MRGMNRRIARFLRENVRSILSIRVLPVPSETLEEPRLVYRRRGFFCADLCVLHSELANQDDENWRGCDSVAATLAGMLAPSLA